MRALFLAIIAIIAIGCAENTDIITSKERLDNVANRLAARSTWIPKIEDEGDNKSQQQALDFLYAYMPVGDVADYGIEFYKRNIESTLQARSEMAWGAIVPENEFLHFVLPIRVNNETMDTSRVAFYAQLKDRVKGLSMYDAILEVNRWCHEKVSYSPTDGRTISPLGLVSSATGRCGEQSTFTVSALRSVGIPSRQVYVPRWAHTDDNHAWVEAWAADKDGKNGKWYYMGACEPEPVLNMGWFDSSATRSMMMFTKVFGDYNGSEEVMDRTDSYTEINLTPLYAKTAKGSVMVVDSTGNVVSGAKVVFSIYNYASYYPVVETISDDKGMATITAGIGDMVAWASKGGKVGMSKLDLRVGTPVKLVLGAADSVTMIDIAPPAVAAVADKATSAQIELNDKRLAQQNAIREQYVSTFCSKKHAYEIATEIGADTTRVWNVLSAARGNHDNIVSFLLNTPRENIGVALDLLEVVSNKDLTDISVEVLMDHLRGSVHYATKPEFKNYILNPRIDNEMLTPYKAALSGVSCTTPSEIIDMGLKIALVDSLNPARVPISVMGVHKLKMADIASAERYTIALLRSKGIAARREPLTQNAQYFDGSGWVNIYDTTARPELGSLELTYKSNGLNPNPKLDTHFTIARFDGQQYTTIDIEKMAQRAGLASDFHSLFARPLDLEPGRYMLITGTRLANGKVLARNSSFEIKAGQTTNLELVMRLSDDQLQVIGNVDTELQYTPKGEAKATSILSQVGRGNFIVAIIDPVKEPSVHALNDLIKHRAAIEAWGRPILVLFNSQTALDEFNLSRFAGLPKNIIFGVDSNGVVGQGFGRSLDIEDVSRLPIVVVGDSFGRVFYISTGYNISLGEHLELIIENLN